MERIKNNKISDRSTRLLLLVTHGCCLRCKYCFVQQDIQKYMPKKILLRSVDFLMSSSASHLQLQFFGGEPLLLPFKLLKETVIYANKKAKQKEKSLDIIITTNGVLLNKEKVDFFKKYNVIIEVSLDGNETAQNINRPQQPGLPSSYSLIVKNLSLIFGKGIDYRASMVVTPQTVDNLVNNFKHLLGLGFKKIFIMTACGVFWSKRKLFLLNKNLSILEPIFLKLIRKNYLEFLNLKEWLRPLRMNTEISVDFDGNIYSACISYLIHDKKTKEMFVLGNISKIKKNMDFFEKKRLSNSRAMQVIFKENNIIDDLPNNIKAGEIMSDFLQSLSRRLIKVNKKYEKTLLSKK